MRTPIRLRQGGRGCGRRSVLMSGSCLSAPRRKYTEQTSSILPQGTSGYRRSASRLTKIRQILHQGIDGMLGIVNPQVAIMMRSEERAQQNRAIPIGEMLRVCLGVLQRVQKLQTAFQGFAIRVVTRAVLGLAD